MGMGQSTVTRILELFYTRGSVSKRAYPKDKAFRKLTSAAQLLIVNLVIGRPGIYLHEIQDELRSPLEVEVTLSTICMTVASHQKLATFKIPHIKGGNTWNLIFELIHQVHMYSIHRIKLR